MSERGRGLGEKAKRTGVVEETLVLSDRGDGDLCGAHQEEQGREAKGEARSAGRE